MVKCSRCGVEIADSFDVCPNCGNNLTESQTPPESSEDLKCPSCGELLQPDADFCIKCGTKVVNDSNRCENCGSEVPDGVLFCPTCGTKVKQPQRTQQANICPNCGFKIEDEGAFCPECGTNIKTGEKKTIPTNNSNQGFIDKINLNNIIKPTVVALIVAIILSVIGVLIRLSWVSFIIAVILSVGFFAALIDNEANAVVSGLFIGLILGFLENPIIQFCWGKLAARFYEWFFGSQIIILVIVAVVVAYVSNIYLKSTIQDIVGDRLSWL